MYSTIKSKIVYQNKWIRVYENLVKGKNGNTAKFSTISFNEFVEIVPIFGDGSILMIKNYRYAIGKKILELPAGFIDKDEPHSKSARRELLEETGYSCKSLRKVGWYYYNPARSKQKVHVFVAKGLKLTSKQRLGDFEYISLVKLSKEQIVQKMRMGEIKNSSVISALVLAGLR